MALHFLHKGIILGFLTPVGPIGILCIRRTLQYGRLSGLTSGLGAVTADTLYGIVAIFGLSLVMDLLLSGQFWLRLLGGAFLFYLGCKIFFAKPQESNGDISHRSLFGDFISTFFLTMTNPLTFLTYFGIFAGFGMADTKGNHFHSFLLIFGIFIGASLWWIVLTEGSLLFRNKLKGRMMGLFNRVAGLIIIAFGIAAWSTLFIGGSPEYPEYPGREQSAPAAAPQESL